MIHIRPYQPGDRDFIMSLAPRLTIGMAEWRDPAMCLKTVESWLTGSLESHEQKTMVFVAASEDRRLLGFATVTHTAHFTGERQAYIGELAVDDAAEGQGVGQALLHACEEWGRAQGSRIISLATGAANQRALRFYDQAGYRLEDVTLIKLL